MHADREGTLFSDELLPIVLTFSYREAYMHEFNNIMRALVSSWEFSSRGTLLYLLNFVRCTSPSGWRNALVLRRKHEDIYLPG